MKHHQCENCGGTEFLLIRSTFTAVDFGREGATKGHPFVGVSSETFHGFECASPSCRRKVPSHIAQEMYREVI